MYMFAWTKPWKWFDSQAIIISALQRFVHLGHMMYNCKFFVLINRRMLTKLRIWFNVICQKWSMTHKLLESHRSKMSITHETIKSTCLPGYHYNDYHNACILNTLYFCHGSLLTSFIMVNSSLTCSVFFNFSSKNNIKTKK